MAENLAFDWYLKDWMSACDISQAELERRTGWSKRKASYLVSGRQPYNRWEVDTVARVLHLQPYELLMHPDDAMQIRRMHALVNEQARLKVADRQSTFTAEPAELTPLVKDRKAV